MEYGVAGQDRHAALPGKKTITLCVTRFCAPSIAVHVKPGDHPGIGAGSERVRVIQTGIAQGIAKRVQGLACEIVVKALQGNNIWGSLDQHRDHGCYLSIFAAHNVAQQQPRTFPLQFCVVRRNSERIGACAGRKKECAEQDQAVWKSGSSAAMA